MYHFTVSIVFFFFQVSQWRQWIKLLCILFWIFSLILELIFSVSIYIRNVYFWYVSVHIVCVVWAYSLVNFCCFRSVICWVELCILYVCSRSSYIVFQINVPLVHMWVHSSTWLLFWWLSLVYIILSWHEGLGMLGSCLYISIFFFFFYGATLYSVSFVCFFFCNTDTCVANRDDWTSHMALSDLSTGWRVPGLPYA